MTALTNEPHSSAQKKCSAMLDIYHTYILIFDTFCTCPKQFETVHINLDGSKIILDLQNDKGLVCETFYSNRVKSNIKYKNKETVDYDFIYPLFSTSNTMFFWQHLSWKFILTWLIFIQIQFEMTSKIERILNPKRMPM